MLIIGLVLSVDQSSLEVNLVFWSLSSVGQSCLLVSLVCGSVLSFGLSRISVCLVFWSLSSVGQSCEDRNLSVSLCPY
jgi:hypothetical protein